MSTESTADGRPPNEVVLSSHDLVLVLDSKIERLCCVLEHSRRLHAELCDAIAALRGRMPKFARALSHKDRPTRPCAASLSISIVNIPVAKCRANAQANWWGQDQMWFTPRCHAAKGALGGYRYRYPDCTPRRTEPRSNLSQTRGRRRWNS